MKKTALALLILGALPLAAAADVTKEDIKKLAAAGISDDVIITYVKANGPVQKLTPDDLIELKQAGVSEKVLGVLAAGAAPAPVAPPARTEVRTEVIERPVYVPQTTYVTTPTYYSSSIVWCSRHYCYDACGPEVSYSPYVYSYPTYYPSYYSYPRSYCAPRYSYPSYSIYYGSGYRYCGPRSGFSVSYRW